MIVNLPDISVRCDYTIQMYSAYMGKVYYMKDPMCVYRYNSAGSWTSRTINSDRQEQVKRYEGEKDILNSYNRFLIINILRHLKEGWLQNCLIWHVL